MVVSSMTLSFAGNPNFCEYITSFHIQHSIYVRQFEFFVLNMKQIAFIFCNVSFAGQYIFCMIKVLATAHMHI